jgi:hypothetical protein
MDCPAGVDVDTSHMDHAIRAQYSVEQAGDRMIVRATGELPAGYEAVFVRSPMQVYPPQFTLMRHRLHGQYPAMQKRFDSCVAFKRTEPVEQITVHDAEGPHAVAPPR